MPDCAVEILQCALYTLAGTAAELVRTVLKDLEGIGSYIIWVSTWFPKLPSRTSKAPYWSVVYLGVPPLRSR